MVWTLPSSFPNADQKGEDITGSFHFLIFTAFDPGKYEELGRHDLPRAWCKLAAEKNSRFNCLNATPSDTRRLRGLTLSQKVTLCNPKLIAAAITKVTYHAFRGNHSLLSKPASRAGSRSIPQC